MKINNTSALIPSLRVNLAEIITSNRLNLPFLDNYMGLPWWLRWESICLQCRRLGFNSWVWKISWKREWQPTPVFLPGEFHGQRSLQFDGVAKSWTDWSNLAGTHTPPPSRPCESGFAVCHDARWFAGTWKFQRPQRFWWEWAWFPAVSSKRQKKLLALRLGKKSCTSSHFSRRDMKWLLGCPVIPEVARDPLSKRVERGGREGLLWQTAYFSWIPPLVRGPAG